MGETNRILQKAVVFSHEIAGKAISPGRTAVDATAGNGYDTLFLAEAVGNSGKVYAFDIQEEALRNTEARLQKHNLWKRVKLIHDSHENMGKYIPGQVAVVMFNLGYLPGGDRSIVTRPHTTLAALSVSLNLLEKGGVVTIVVYTGHSGGQEEAQALNRFLENLDQKKYTAVSYKLINQTNNPPFLLAIEKEKEQFLPT